MILLGERNTMWAIRGLDVVRKLQTLKDSQPRICTQTNRKWHTGKHTHADRHAQTLTVWPPRMRERERERGRERWKL